MDLLGVWWEPERADCWPALEARVAGAQLGALALLCTEGGALTPALGDEFARRRLRTPVLLALPDRVGALALAAAPDPAARARAAAEVRAWIDRAAALGATTLVLPAAAHAALAGPAVTGAPETPLSDEQRRAWRQWRDGAAGPATENLCRTLHPLLVRHRGLRLAFLTPAAPDGFPDAAALALAAAELPPGLGYWHHTALAARRQWWGLEPEDAALAAADRLLAGVSLADFDPRTGRSDLPPGLGAVQWPPVAQALTAAIPRALHLDRRASPLEHELALAFLRERGLFRP